MIKNASCVIGMLPALRSIVGNGRQQMNGHTSAPQALANNKAIGSYRG